MSQKNLQDIYPLSPLQEGLLFHALQPQSGLYMSQVACRLNHLEPDAFLRSWRQVINRHTSLRSAIVWKSTDKPLQLVARRVGLPVEQEDWRGLSREDQERRLESFLRRDRERGFKLSRAPLLRLALFRLGGGEYQLVWSYHHLIFDGWCRALILREIIALYEAEIAGRTMTLPSARPYRDYLTWLERQDPQATEDFWRRKLAGVERTDLPIAHDGERLPSQACEKRIALSASQTTALLELGRRYRLTSNTLALGLYALLRSRYTGSRRPLFGAVFTGRPASLPGGESMVGMFANALPVAVRVEERTSAISWFERVQGELVELREFEHTPLAQIQKWAGEGESFFDDLFTFQNYPREDSLAGLGTGISISAARSVERGNYPLYFIVEPGKSWRLEASYDRKWFGPTQIGRMLKHYRLLLATLLEDAERPLEEFSLLSPAEGHQLLVQWNDVPAQAASPLPAHELFSAAASKAPDRPAVFAPGEVLSRGELMVQAEHLCHRLLRLGLGSEKVVAILTERSLALPVAILGILKAGCAFLPLDPTYPKERLTFLLSDSRASAVVTEGRCALGLDEGIPRIHLRGGGVQGAVGGGQEVVADDLAYVIYTSGSSGRPKGVAVPHRCLSWFAQEMGGQLELSAEDRMLQFASPGFDVLIEELFPVWLYGGAVVLERPESLASPVHLAAAMERQRVTTVELPAVYWHEWVHELRATDTMPPSCLRRLLLGSEKPDSEQLAVWSQFKIPTVLVFGLTETTVTSALHRVPEDVEGGAVLPMGRPPANHRLYVLDPRGRPTTLGVAGELFIGGEGVSRGYLRRPGLTATRFVPDPWSPTPGGRLYRTGDRVAYRNDGNLDFLGRLDHQIKVRGFRIEPGEVEASLRTHPGVREAVVDLREAADGHRRLVAYVLAVEGEVEEAQLAAHLLDRLPEHMVPSIFVQLAELPLSPHGKIDREALPTPEAVMVGRRAVAVAPRNAQEEALVGIWQDVLGVASVGVEDSFFELGGDSILSIRIASRAQRQGLDVTPGQVFELKTVARLAAEIASGQSAPTMAEATTDEVFLTPVQHWFFERVPVAPQHWNMPLLLRPSGELRPDLLALALTRVVEHHQGLRVRFEPQEKVWQPCIEERVGAIALPRIDLSNQGEELKRQLLASAAGLAQTTLDLSRAPLFRALWFDLGRGEQRLLLVAHHLVVDAVSWRVVVQDLEQAWRRLHDGEEVALAPTSGLGAWTVRLEEAARGERLGDELEYWQKVTAQPSARLAVDFDSEKNVEGSVGEVSALLSREETEALLQEVPGAYRTQINDVLLAALVRLSAKWPSGHGGLRVELEGHGREEGVTGLDGSRTVGWLSTLYPVWLPPRDELGESLVAVKEALRAVPRRGIGYGLLRYMSAEGSRVLGAQQTPEVLFNYLGRVDHGQADSNLFELATEEIGAAIDPRCERRHLLEINARIADGHLQVRMRYSRTLHRRATAEAWAEGYITELRNLIAHCTTPGVGRFTPSDFPLAGMDAAALERVTAAVHGEIEDIYCLSPLQEGMLFHSIYQPGDGVYVAQLQATLRGDLDTAALRRAWQEVVRRHVTLRTSFFWQELDRPVQVVVQKVEVPWQVEDFSLLSSSDRAARFANYLEADRHRGFEPERAPLLRLALVRTGEEEHRLLVSLHQMLLDGWSLPLLLADVFSLYEAAVAGSVAELPQRPPFRRYLEWISEQDISAAETFWRRQLAGYHEPVGLSLVPPADGAGYAESCLTLGRRETASLVALAQRHQLTLNTLVQGAWAVLLSRYCGRQEVVFGAAVSGRPAELAGVESMLGLLINTLPVRLQLVPREPLWQWLSALQKQHLQMREYEFSPLSEVQRWSDVPAGQPLFESILVFQNYPVAEGLKAKAGKLGVSEIETVEQTNFPLTLMARPGEELEFSLSHQTQVLAPPAARRLLRHLHNLLRDFSALREPALGDLRLLSAAERHQLFYAWNDTERHWESEAVVHRLFEKQAAHSPEAVAVLFENQSLSYGELNRRASRLAAHLTALGIAPEVSVGVFVERSMELMVGLLAVLKAGGAYVPLDPEFPAQRLRSMIEEVSIQVVLHRRSAPPEGWGEDLRWVDLDGGGVVLGQESRQVVRSLHPAYVIFTSGSSGRPKATVTCHRAICNRLFWIQRQHPLTTVDRVLQKTPLSFDVSVWEVFWPLTAGAQLVVARPGGHRDSAYLEQVTQDCAITLLHFVPSMLEMFLEQPGLKACRSLRRVICSGEALSPSLVERCLERLPVDLLNLYGPTEAAVEVSSQACGVGDRSIAIGRPIANTRLYVLNRQLLPIPPGVEGELYIGGRPPARGYHKQPGRTAERFVPDPYAGVEGARIYRTGDRVYQRWSGEIEYLGRLDFQVKIRGVRIELGEIEAVLAQHSGVLQVAAVLHRGTSGRPRIIAHVTTALGAAPTERELRTFLRERLPEAMMPSAFRFWDTLPLGTSGKLDRAALVWPPEELEEDSTESSAARSLAEEQLAGIWCEVLDLEDVEGENNFLELGGDSILSMLVASKAARRGLRLSPREVLQSDSLSELALALEQRLGSDAEQALVSGELPLTPIQRWLFEQNPKDPHYFNQTVLLEVLEGLRVPYFRRALDMVLAHHDALRLRFQHSVAGWSQYNAGRETEVILTVIDLRHLAESDRWPALRVAAERLQSSLDLAEGPLVRAAFLRCGEVDHDYLVVTAHHLVIDGISWQLVLEDLTTAYAHLRQGQRVVLPPKTTSFKHWAESLTAHATSEKAMAELNYWTDENRRRVPPLPVDRPDGVNTVSSFRSHWISLSREETNALFQAAQATYRMQIQEVMLFALGRTLAVWSGEEKVLIDVEGHGREEIFEGINLSRTVGWFTSIYPVLLAVGRDGEIDETLRAVREQLRNIPRNGIGYGLLRYLTSMGEELAALPQAEVLFNFFGQVKVDRALGSTLFSWSRKSLGPAMSPRSSSLHRLKIDGLVTDGRLEFEWAYSCNLFKAETIEGIASTFLSQLRALLEHCRSPSAREFAPSDFALAKLKKKQLDRLAQKYGRET